MNVSHTKVINTTTTVKQRLEDIVLIKEEVLPRMRWRKGRIEKLIRGNGSLVRGVELKVDLGIVVKQRQFADHCS